MKPALFLIAIVLLSTTNTNAQMLAFADQSSTAFTVYSAASYKGNRPERIAAIVLMGAGVGAVGIGGITALVGALGNYSAYQEYNANMCCQQGVDQATLNQGHKLEAIGAGVAVVGAAMLITGGVLLRSSFHHSRYGVIAPKNNAVGLAYNF